MKCANCGNDNPKDLFDDGDAVYCNICCHRTRKDTGLDDVVICPV